MKRTSSEKTSSRHANALLQHVITVYQQCGRACEFAADKLSICLLSRASRMRPEITCWTILHVLSSQARALTAC